MENIKIIKSENLKTKIQDSSKLGFGRIFTDHMFVMKYKKGKGWHDAEIKPYSNLSLDPSSMCFHYGQCVFEGLKAYKKQDGSINLFRPYENFKRLNKSNERMCIPQINVEFCVEALKELVNIDREWIPNEEDASLYIRPFIISTEAHLGVNPSEEYLFVIIMSPSGAYYKEGLKPVDIYVESKYVRAIKGGTGEAKTAGNYASSLAAQELAHKQGFSQVLWLNALDNNSIEEVGAMNIFFVIKDTVITPELNGSILDGITRKSCIQLLKNEGYNVEERRITIQEVLEAYKNNELKEIFGTGTAAVISLVGNLKYKDNSIIIYNKSDYKISLWLYNKITSIQRGKEEDKFSWNINIK